MKACLRTLTRLLQRKWCQRFRNLWKGLLWAMTCSESSPRDACVREWTIYLYDVIGRKVGINPLPTNDAHTYVTWSLRKPIGIYMGHLILALYFSSWLVLLLAVSYGR